MRLHQQRLIASMRALQRPRGLLVACFVVAYVYLGVGMVTPAFAQRKNPASKLYVAELDGVSDIDIGDRVFELKKGSVHDANNTIIRTRVGASNAIVFSNGTGLHLEPDTALRIEQFVQEPFLPNRTDLDVEPSVSRMSLVLTHGMIGLCTSKLVAGSSMELKTPHLMLQIRGKRIVVETNERQTVVSLIEGDVTVQAGDREGGGRTLTAWQRAVVKPILANDSFELVVEDIPESERRPLEDKAALACMARQTVYFDTGDGENAAIRAARGGNSVFDQGDDEVIRPIPVVPSIPEVPTFVSPSEIEPPGGGGTSG
jgi:hypothetical protein